MHVHESGLASRRFHVLDAFGRMNPSRIWPGASTSRLVSPAKMRETSKNNDATVQVGEALIYSHAPITGVIRAIRNETSNNKHLVITRCIAT